MSDDYRDAADRHLKDAEYLFLDARLANADQIYGLAAECALKAVIEALMRTPLNRKYYIHINKLWNEFTTFASGRMGIRCLSLLPSGLNPFSSWNITQRYCNQAFFTKEVVESHKQAAQNAMSVLQAAILDGVLK